MTVPRQFISQFQHQLQRPRPRSCRIRKLATTDPRTTYGSPCSSYSTGLLARCCQILTGRLSAAAASLMAGQFGHVGTLGGLRLSAVAARKNSRLAAAEAKQQVKLFARRYLGPRAARYVPQKGGPAARDLTSCQPLPKGDPSHVSAVGRQR